MVGCPEDLYIQMLRLADIAPHAGEQAAISEASDIELYLRQWICSDESESSTLEPDELIDRIHGKEAWRWGLLLYIYSVFRKNQASTAYFARQVIDHVDSILPGSTVQKETLLSMVLAGAETKNSDNRVRARAIVERWANKTTMGMFRDGVAFLDDVWSQNISWTDYVDNSGEEWLFG